MEGLGGRHVEWRFSPPAFLQWGTRYTMELNITVPNWKGSTGIELFSFNSKRKQRAHMFSRSCAIVYSCSRIFWNFSNPSYFSFRVVIFLSMWLFFQSFIYHWHEWQRRTHQDLRCLLHHLPFRLAYTSLHEKICWRWMKLKQPSFRSENWRKILTYFF